MARHRARLVETLDRVGPRSEGGEVVAEKIRLFVYGTLMSGEPYHHRLMEKARFLCKTKTAPSFHLVDLGTYPGLVEGGETPVVGELYEIDEALQTVIDRLEGHPHLYHRTSICLEGGEEVTAYLLPRKAAQRFPVVPDGDWKKYQRRL